MRPTELCVLGVHHLPANLHDAALVTARDKLVAWAPDAVAIELLPSEQAYLASLLDPDDAAQTLFSVREPREGAESVAGLHDWTFAQARAVALDEDAEPAHRVVAFLATFEPYTAALLADGVELPEGPRAFLDELARTGGERARLALPVARELGHRRLWQFDDFTDGSLSDEDWAAMMAALGEVMPPRIAPFDQEHAAANASGNVWPHWVKWNGPDGLARLEDLNTGSHLLPEAAGVEEISRRRIAQWRGRNLHMAANLRQVTGQFPGGRVLAIVGCGHARPLRAALSADQHDLVLVDVAALD